MNKHPFKHRFVGYILWMLSNKSKELCQRNGEYADYISCRWVRPLQKGCLEYDTKLYPVVKLLFWTTTISGIFFFVITSRFILT